MSSLAETLALGVDHDCRARAAATRARVFSWSVLRLQTTQTRYMLTLCSQSSSATAVRAYPPRTILFLVSLLLGEPTPDGAGDAPAAAARVTCRDALADGSVGASKASSAAAAWTRTVDALQHDGSALLVEKLLTRGGEPPGWRLIVAG